MSLSSSVESGSGVDRISADGRGGAESGAARMRPGRAVSGGARTARPRIRLSGSFAMNELATMFGRTRNRALLAALAAIPLALGVAIKLTTNHPNGGGGFISQV